MDLHFTWEDVFFPGRIHFRLSVSAAFLFVVLLWHWVGEACWDDECWRGTFGKLIRWAAWVAKESVPAVEKATWYR